MIRKMLAGLFALAFFTSALAGAQTHTDVGGTVIPGVSAGQIKEICVTPTVTTANAYGANYVVGGLLTFPLALPPSGGGVLQSVYVDGQAVESMGFTFTPFAAQPTATTWTDAAVAAIAAADRPLARGSIAIVGSSALGAHTAAQATQIGQALNVGGTTLYGVLTANAALTNNFAAATDVKVCVDVVQFP